MTSGVFAHAKASKDPVDLQEGSLYYSRSDSHLTTTDGEGKGEVMAPKHEEWEANYATYSSIENNGEMVSEKERNGNEVGVEEGWEDNSLYNVNDDYQSEEWCDNSIYAGSGDEE